MEEIKESIAQLSQVFHQKMDTFESEYRKNPSVPAPTPTQDSEYNTFKLFVLTALRLLQNQVELLDKGVDSIEMRGRRKMLLFHGLPEEKTENSAAIITKTVLDQLKIPGFVEGDIARCHRMGRSSASHKPRPILVKFRDMAVRSKAWSCKTSLKGSGVTISEFLTRPRHETFMAARERFGVTRCWTRDGYIFVLDGENSRHRVSCMKELDSISRPAAAASISSAKGTVSSKRTVTPPAVPRAKRTVVTAAKK